MYYSEEAQVRMFTTRTSTLLLVEVILLAALLIGCANSASTKTPLVDIPRPTSASTTLSTPSFTPVPNFPRDIYPSPLPFLQPVNGISTRGCPDLTNVDVQSELPVDTALKLINALRSGDLDIFKQASDQSYWPAPQTVLSSRENVNPSDIQVHPAVQTPYDGLIRTGCAQKTLDLSWWVEVGTGALGEHYFLINRSGNWLVWASYP
jgi:hypothetical protein